MTETACKTVPPILDGLQIIEVHPPDAGQRLQACWVIGVLCSHSFCAKLYPQHAQCSRFELRKSRISKLEIHQMTDDRVVARFDRGWDIEPQTMTAQGVLDILATSLADYFYTNQLPDFPIILRAHKRGGFLVSFWTSLNELFTDLLP